MATKLITENRRARHDYQLLDSFEAGVALHGGEVKSVRAGEVSLAEAFVHIRGGEAYLSGAYIKPFAAAATTATVDPTRARKLLLHHRELATLTGAVRAKSQTIVPLKLYLKNGYVKVEIALAKGKKRHDKRHALKAKEHRREARQAAGRHHSSA